MNKKLPGLLKPNVRLYFIMLTLFAISTVFFAIYRRESSIELGIAQFIMIFILIIYSRIASKKRTANLLDYIESVSDGMDLTIRDIPLPIMIYNPDTDEIIWANDKFITAAGMKTPFFDRNISDVVPDYNGEWFLNKKHEYPEALTLGEGKYKVFGNMVRTDTEYIATTYWIDISAHEEMSEEYYNSRLVFAVLLLDNYDDFLRDLSEKEKSILTSNIDEKINVWASGKGGYLCRSHRDRYFFLFEERHLDEMLEDKFSILDNVRTEISSNGVHATLCIGVGKDGETPNESYRFASLGVEMALSRGGDQAVLRNRYGFEFFGGHSKQFERRTKVRSRIMANAFGELLNDASTVFIMGHKMADYDSVGAAIGVNCIARSKNKPARIVMSMEDNLALNIINAIKKLPEYSDVFISEQEAILEMDSKSLLVIVDTNRPDQVESKALLLSSTRIAVIDHHRRAADYIDNAVLNFHEPHASSTAELVTELLQYLVDRADILRLEAEALLAGLVLDTKGFSINTGSGTFDAAASLRRAGADVTDVKRYLQSDIKIATARYALMREATMYIEGVTIAVGNEEYSRLEIAQAADELLNISGVNTSFAVARTGDYVYVSGRSIGGLNVQVVLEKLGGGGSQSTAGLQMKDKSVEEVVTRLKAAIDECV